jgi:hypothetical protein
MVVIVLVGCVGSDGSDDTVGIHGCIGASLRVDTSGVENVDGVALAAALEASVEGLVCEHREIPGVLDCLPVDDADGCGFEDRAEAEVFEEDFRAALGAAEPALADYPYDVIDECYCRVY